MTAQRVRDMNRRELINEKRALALALDEEAKHRERLRTRFNRVKMKLKEMEGTAEYIAPGVVLGACDHSIIRYLERGLGYNVRAAEDALIELARAGDPRCIVKDGLIVTYLDDEMKRTDEMAEDSADALRQRATKIVAALQPHSKGE